MADPARCRVTTEYANGKEAIFLEEISFEEMAMEELLYIQEIQDSSKILRDILEEMNLKCNDIDSILEWFNSPEEMKKRSKTYRYSPKLNVRDFAFELSANCAGSMIGIVYPYQR